MMLVVGKWFKVSCGNVIVCFRDYVLRCVCVLFIGNVDLYKYIGFVFSNEIGF